MNGKKIKSNFPIFGRKGVPKEFVYLDSAATSQKPQQVIDAMSDFYSNHNANVHRGVHDLSEQATKHYEEVREKVAQRINAKDSSEIIFTSGATEGINFIADAWARQHLKPGDEIVLTEVEHHANLLPWQRLAKERGLTLRFIPINRERFIIGCPKREHYAFGDTSLYSVGMRQGNAECCNDPNCDYLQNIITKKTKLLAITSESNVLGPIWNEKTSQLQAVIDRARAQGAKVLIDAAQTVPHQKIDVQKLKADFLVFSGHKMLGPTGVGILYIAKDLHDAVVPYQLGGAMVHSVSFEEMRLLDAPHKFEAGTPPIAQVIGLGAALDYLALVDTSELKKHEASLCSALIKGLEDIDGVEIIGNRERIKQRGHLVSFIVDGAHPHDLASYLDMRGIAVRAGHHCAQPLASLLGLEATVRVSFYVYNTTEDVELFLKELQEAITFLRIKK